MNSEVSRLMHDNDVLLVITSKERHQSMLTEATDTLLRDFGGVALVGWRMPASTLSAQFTKAGIDVRKLFFVDVLTASVKHPEKTQNTLYVHSPSDLTELSLAISEIIKTGAFKSLLVDEIGAMLIYQEHEPVIQFIHNLITKCRVAGVKLVIMDTVEGSPPELIKDLHMFVDKVATIAAPSHPGLVEAIR